jgi:uncharacterized metal-binding protein YceD (DUF177 family)
MPLRFNLRHLEHKSLVLQGELSPEEMELATLDELIQVPRPLQYHLEVERLEDSVLVRGRLSIVLACECGRCLKPYDHPLVLDNWTCHLPLEGEDQVDVVNDCVDLTPYLREDILLAFPLHPLCGSDCGGLSYPPQKMKGTAGEPMPVSSAWAELNKLKL